jgi:hypothetical protein
MKKSFRIPVIKISEDLPFKVMVSNKLTSERNGPQMTGCDGEPCELTNSIKKLTNSIYCTIT